MKSKFLTPAILLFTFFLFNYSYTSAAEYASASRVRMVSSSDQKKKDEKKTEVAKPKATVTTSMAPVQRDERICSLSNTPIPVIAKAVPKK